MELKDQVASLELSKRLKELGVKQESLFFWVSRGYGEGCFLSKETKFVYGSAPDLSEADYPVCVSAFTVAELGEILPSYIHSEKAGGEWGAVCHEGRELIGRVFWADTEADARASMLIYLIENKLI